MAGKNLTAKEWLDYLMTFHPRSVEECVKLMFDIVTDWKNENDKHVTNLDIKFTGADELRKRFAEERANVERANNRLPADWRTE